MNVPSVVVAAPYKSTGMLATSCHGVGHVPVGAMDRLLPPMRDCASANGITHTAKSGSRINALRRRCALMVGLICFFICFNLLEQLFGWSAVLVKNAEACQDIFWKKTEKFFDGFDLARCKVLGLGWNATSVRGFWGAQAACSCRQLASNSPAGGKQTSVRSMQELFGKLPKRTGWQPVLPTRSFLSFHQLRCFTIERGVIRFAWLQIKLG